MNDLIERAVILLKATQALLNRQDNSSAVLNLLCEQVHYDDVNCDGYCLLDDIEIFLEEVVDCLPALDNRVLIESLLKANYDIQPIDANTDTE